MLSVCSVCVCWDVFNKAQAQKCPPNNTILMDKNGFYISINKKLYTVGICYMGLFNVKNTSCTNFSYFEYLFNNIINMSLKVR